MSRLVLAKKKYVQPSNEVREILRLAGSNDFWAASEAQRFITKALTEPLREGILPGDIISGIFEEKFLQPGMQNEYPKSFVTPDNAGEFIAYVCPVFGRLPQRQVVGDYVTVPTYMIWNSIDVSLRYLRDADWDVVSKMNEVNLMGHVRKKNNDGFHTLMAAGAARNVVVNDSSAAAGLFTKRLVALLQTNMKRLGGGNTASPKRRKLTDLYLSLEGIQDMRSWDLTQVDDVTRREIYLASDDSSDLNMIFGTRMHPLDEFGVGQEYELYLENTLGASLGSKQEFVMGLDLQNNDSFVMPVRERISVNPDPFLHRELKFGMWSTEEFGFGVLDGRSVLLGAF